MALTEGTSPALLACGRDPAVVWEHADHGRLDRHESGCRYCQTVAADAAVLHAAVVELAAEPLEPPAALVERVMSVVRAELRRDYLPLPAAHGPAQVEHGSAAAVLRRAVDQMPGVRLRSCRISVPEPDDRAPSGWPGATVRLTASMQFGADLASTAARVRQMIVTAADRLLGLPVGRVDIDIVDVHQPSSPPASGEGIRG